MGGWTFVAPRLEKLMEAAGSSSGGWSMPAASRRRRRPPARTAQHEREQAAAGRGRADAHDAATAPHPGSDGRRERLR